MKKLHLKELMHILWQTCLQVQFKASYKTRSSVLATQYQTLGLKEKL